MEVSHYRVQIKIDKNRQGVFDGCLIKSRGFGSFARLKVVFDESYNFMG